DTNYLVQLDGEVRLVVPLADGSALIAGSFTNVNGQPSPNLARLRADGSLDPGFLQGMTLDGTIYSLALDSADRLLVAGDFQTVRGSWCPGLARLRSDGFLDPTFSPFKAWPTNVYSATTMNAVAVLPDGSIVCGGTVPVGTYYSTNAWLKLSSTGEVYPGFTNPPVMAGMNGLTVLPSGALLVVGQGLGSSLVKMNSEGALDFGFLPPADLQFTY
ncbi:MAG: hypothetical protein ACREIC_27040, partial [Limisphaerales bacterium]